MLKRCQILLDNWQVDYVKQAAERFDISFSEVVRIFVSEAVLCILFTMEPNKKIGITMDELTKLKEKFTNPDTPQEKRHELISKLYFEARKASEINIREKQK